MWKVPSCNGIQAGRLPVEQLLVVHAAIYALLEQAKTLKIFGNVDVVNLLLGLVLRPCQLDCCGCDIS